MKNNCLKILLLFLSFGSLTMLCANEDYMAYKANLYDYAALSSEDIIGLKLDLDSYQAIAHRLIETLPDNVTEYTQDSFTGQPRQDFILINSLIKALSLEEYTGSLVNGCRWLFQFEELSSYIDQSIEDVALEINRRNLCVTDRKPDLNNQENFSLLIVSLQNSKNKHKKENEINRSLFH